MAAYGRGAVYTAYGRGAVYGGPGTYGRVPYLWVDCIFCSLLTPGLAPWMTLGVSWATNCTSIGTMGSIVLGPANCRGAVLGAVVAVLGAVVAVPDPMLTPFWACTTKTCLTCWFGVLTSILSSKLPSPAWEEISEAGPEPEADTGFDKIQASRRGKAAEQCCLPRWLALALASIKDLLSSPTVWKSIPHKYCRDSQNPGYIRQLPPDTADMKRGRHAKTWSVCNVHRRSPCFPANKNKPAGKQAQNNNNKNNENKYRNLRL